MAENFFHNDYLIKVSQSNLSKFIGKKIHANKFLKETESYDLTVKYVGDGKIILINDFNDFIEGDMV